MIVYLFTLILVSLAVHMAKKSGSGVSARIFLFAAFATMVIIAGLRAHGVGTDTRTYIDYFDRLTSLNAAIAAGANTLEFSYWILNWLVHFVSDEYMALLFAIALIVVLCYQCAIVANSLNIDISFFVFITMGFYTFFFNGARQGIACAICALSTGPLLKRNLKKYLLCIAVAASFHKTAIAMIPVYFLLKRSNTIKTNMLYGLLGIACALSLDKITEIVAKFDMRYQSYSTTGDGGGYLTVAFTCALCIFFAIFKKFIRFQRQQYCLFLNMIIIGAIISLTSALLKINPSGLLRLSLYFNVSVLFLWPIVYKNMANFSERVLFNFIFISGHLIFFVLTTERFSNLTPYKLNPLIHF